jgi:hypothetical protein
MRGFLLVLSMLTSLVVCPFECMGRMTAGQDKSASAGKCCCCSHGRTDSQDPSDPSPGSPRCDCICNGALLTDSVLLSMDATFAGTVNLSEATALLELTLAAAHAESAEAARRIRPGRSVHLALHSLQI